MLNEAYTLNDGIASDEVDPTAGDVEALPSEDDANEDDSLNGEADIENIINNIRELTLQGIQAYAQDVQNPRYDLLKKIWLLCDKCLSEEDDEIDNK
jgi:hypothetical protein